VQDRGIGHPLDRFLIMPGIEILDNEQAQQDFGGR
jgi:hypothetical protein